MPATPVMTTDLRIQSAYAQCQAISRRHYENFPTASRIVPKDRRKALAAIYAFARAADDFADEPGKGTPEERLQSLANWREHLKECYAKPLEQISHPVFLALGDAVRRYRLSFVNLDNLLRAFERDVQMNRHQNFDSLLSYCTCSANPVGRLVLEMFDYRDAELFALSDFICTGLQLTNFWQDVSIDLERDRVYVPLDDLERFGLSLSDVERFRSSQVDVKDDRWRRLMSFEVERTGELFERGRVLPERVGREVRRQLRLTLLCGLTILERIRRADYDVFHHRPALKASDFVRLYFRTWMMPRTPFQTRTVARS